MAYYEIVVETNIDQRRFREFTNLNFRPYDAGRTMIYGTLSDQSELFSVISKIRDLNLTLVYINRG